MVRLTLGVGCPVVAISNGERSLLLHVWRVLLYMAPHVHGITATIAHAMADMDMRTLITRALSEIALR